MKTLQTSYVKDSAKDKASEPVVQGSQASQAPQADSSASKTASTRTVLSDLLLRLVMSIILSALGPHIT